VKPIVFFLRLRTPKVAHFVFGQIFSGTFFGFRALFWQENDKYHRLKMKALGNCAISKASRICPQIISFKIV
jgi:hypothetical protein